MDIKVSSPDILIQRRQIVDQNFNQAWIKSIIERCEYDVKRLYSKENMESLKTREARIKLRDYGNKECVRVVMNKYQEAGWIVQEVYDDFGVLLIIKF
jgi:hypothetical protein